MKKGDDVAVDNDDDDMMINQCVRTPNDSKTMCSEELSFRTPYM